MYKKIILSSVFVTALLSLTACGGQSDTTSSNKNTDHPVFSWAKVAVSNNYSPSGEITNQTPTFTWPAVSGANEYNLGHEYVANPSYPNWTEYTIPAAEAGCATGPICSYKPANKIMYPGTNRAWWIRGKVNNRWQPWSAPYVFNVVNSSGTPPSNAAPTPISPTNNQAIDSNKLVFTFNAMKTANKIIIGYEKQDGTEWKTDYVWSQKSCPPPAPGQTIVTCPHNTTYTPKVKLEKGRYTWWTRAVLKNGSWTNWSQGNDFEVTDTVSKKPATPTNLILVIPADYKQFDWAEFTFEWDASSLSSKVYYDVYHNDRLISKKIEPNKVTHLTLLNHGVSKGVNTYSVVAIDDNGNRSEKTTITVNLIY